MTNNKGIRNILRRKHFASETFCGTKHFASEPFCGLNILRLSKKRIQGGILGLSHPPPPSSRTSEIFKFQGVFRPQRMLSPPPCGKKKFKPILYKFLNTPLSQVFYERKHFTSQTFWTSHFVV